LDTDVLRKVRSDRRESFWRREEGIVEGAGHTNNKPSRAFVSRFAAHPWNTMRKERDNVYCEFTQSRS